MLVYFSQDYIFGRMIRTGELPGSREAAELGDAIKLSDVSLEIHLIGSRLEMTYPELYKNVSRNINMPFKVSILSLYICFSDSSAT